MSLKWVLNVGRRSSLTNKLIDVFELTTHTSYLQNLSLSPFPYNTCGWLLTFVAWSSPNEGYWCDRTPSETYTFDSNNGCDGWGNTDLDTCKEYCSKNTLPPNCKPPTLPVCTHVVWNTKSSWCHLAKACTMKPNSNFLITEKLKPGIV